MLTELILNKEDWLPDLASSPNQNADVFTASATWKEILWTVHWPGVAFTQYAGQGRVPERECCKAHAAPIRAGCTDV